MADQQPERPAEPGRPQRTGRPLHLRPWALGLVFAGGAVGTAARYGVSLILPTEPWPAGTFLVNLTGAFLLGLLLEGLARRGPDRGRRRVARLLLGTGFCGGFTTYSALATETELLLRAGTWALGLAYGLGTVVLGYLATALGVLAAGRVRRAA